MIKELKFEDVLKSIKEGGNITISGGKLHYINDAFCVGEMFGSIKPIDEEKAYSYIKEHVIDANLNNFLYKVVSNVEKSNKVCSVAKKPNWFAKYLKIGNTGYEINLNRCNSKGVNFSNGYYVRGLHISREMSSWERKVNFESKLKDTSLKVMEDFYPYTTTRDNGLIYMHNININFNELLHSENNEDELVDLISDIIIKAF